MKYDVIYADPPWCYGEGTAITPNSYSKSHYNVEKWQDIKEIPVKNISNDDCVLFLWATGPHLQHAFEVMNSWGFTYSTMGFVWDKQKPVVGHYTMSSTEFCLIGKKGKIPAPRGARNVRQFLSAKRGKHSTKPEEIASRINDMFPHQNKVELFARKRRKGWDCLGDALTGKDIRKELDETI